MNKKKTYLESFKEIFGDDLKVIGAILLIIIGTVIQPFLGYGLNKICPSIRDFLSHGDKEKPAVMELFVLGLIATGMLVFIAFLIYQLGIYINHLKYRLLEVKMTQYMPVDEADIAAFNAESIEECIKRIIPYIYRKTSKVEYNHGAYYHCKYRVISKCDVDELSKLIGEFYDNKSQDCGSYEIRFTDNYVSIENEEEEEFNVMIHIEDILNENK